MARITVCDVCLQSGELRYAKWTHGYPGRQNIKLHLCEDHKHISDERGVKNAAEFNKMAVEIMTRGKTPGQIQKT